MYLSLGTLLLKNLDDFLLNYKQPSTGHDPPPALISENYRVSQMPFWRLPWPFWALWAILGPLGHIANIIGPSGPKGFYPTNWDFWHILPKRWVSSAKTGNFWPFFAKRVGLGGSCPIQKILTRKNWGRQKGEGGSPIFWTKRKKSSFFCASPYIVDRDGYTVDDGVILWVMAVILWIMAIIWWIMVVCGSSRLNVQG